MTFPAKSTFPPTIWDGGSDTRKTANDVEGPLVVHRLPDAEDYSQLQAEIIAIETALQSVRVIVAAANTGAVANAATGGFGYAPTVAGTPSGVPAATPAGFVPILYDTTAHKIWVYDAGWKATGALS